MRHKGAVVLPITEVASTVALFVALVSVACSESPLPTQPTRTQPTPDPGAAPLLTFAGVVSESETGTPLAGVSVCWPLKICALTGPDGSYQFTAVSPVDPNAYRTDVFPYAHRDGFETRGTRVTLTGSRVSWSPTLQRRITVEAGRSVMSTILRGEGSGIPDERDEGLCEPCKSLNVSVPRSGTLVVRLMAESTGSGLQLEVPYAGFRPDDGSLPITTERNIRVIVKAVVVPAKFELSTMFIPGS